MKTAFLFGSLNRGGTETLMLDICKNLQNKDFEAIGVYRKRGVLEEEFIKSGIPFYFVPTSKNRVKYLLNLRKIILSKKVDIIHAQQPIDAIYAKVACVGLRIKIVLTFHGFDYGSNTRLLSFISKRTDINLFVSNYQKKYYTKKYKLNDKKQNVLYNGIDFKKMQVKQHAVSIRQELKLSENSLLLGMVGNFNEVRNQLFICRFLKLLTDRNITFHFIFVGKRIDNMPHRYDECVNFCEKNRIMSKVSFLGVRNDVPDILPQLDAFIYATEHDTFGIAVVEAIAAGIPVFVNDWKVIKEITENGKLATLYKTNQEIDLLEKFMVFLQNKNKHLENAQKSAMYIQEKYSIEKHIENLKAVYNSLA